MRVLKIFIVYSNEKPKKNYAHGLSSFTKLSVTKWNMVILEVNIFVIPWKILLLNLFSFSLLCCFRTGNSCHEKVLADNKMKGASLLCILVSESFVLYYEIPLTHFKSIFHFYTHRKQKTRGFLCLQMLQKW